MKRTTPATSKQAFDDALKRVLRVPREEVAEEERKYQEERRLGRKPKAD